MEKKNCGTLRGQGQLQSSCKNKIYADIAKTVETSFDTSNYEAEKHLPIGKTKKGD